MKKLHTRFRILLAAVASVALLAVTGFASADPPSRVARLGYASGAVSFSPAGEEDWVQATINRPLTTGDRLWVDAGARAEVQVGGAMIRMNAATSVAVLNLDDSITQLQLTQGTLNVRVRRLDPNQVIEVDTPNLAFTVRQPGDYRLMVDAEGNATSIYVRKGQGEVYGEGASYVVDPRQPYRFTGTGLREYEPLVMAGLDDFDRWGIDRDRGYDTSVSARYVSPDVIGYQDLDANGTWRVDAAYGNVWVPTRVAAGWAPYRDGHWAWIDPWGWTWVDDAPWGFAVSHYGRWTNLSGTWGWVPGPVRTRAYYAPALVAFVGGNNFSLAISTGNVGGIAWFPLGPREVYRPSYAVSRRYFENVNVSNTVVTTTVINNYYNNSNVTNVTYVNRQVPGAIVAVPTSAFVQSQPVNRSAVRVTQEMVANAPVAAVAAVAPTEKSVRGAAAQREKPPARAVERPVVAHAAPPAAPAGFAAQQQQLAATPGKPLDDTERKQLKRPDRAPQAEAVKVIAQPNAAPPTALPPAATAANRPDGRGKAGDRMDVSAPPVPGIPAAATQGTAPTRIAPPASTSQSAEARGKAGARGQDEQRAAVPAASPPPSTRVAVPTTPAQPQGAAPAPPAPPQVAGRPPAVAEPTAKAVDRAKDNGKSDEQRAKQERQQEEQRVRAAARPPSAPQAAAPVPPAQTQMAAPAPSIPPPQRSAQPKAVPAPEASPAPQAMRPAKPDPTPVAKQTERRPPGTPATSEPVPAAKAPERGAPVAAANAPVPEAPRAPKANAPAPESKPPGKGDDKKKKDADEEEKKQKG